MSARALLAVLLVVSCSKTQAELPPPAPDDGAGVAERPAAATTTAPGDAGAPAGAQGEPDLVIGVVALRWRWLFEYPGGLVSDELHLPTSARVRLHMRSADVEHELYAPALRLKRVIPAGGEVTVDVAVGDKPNRSEVVNLAAGDPKNEQMRAALVVEPAVEHAAWLREARAADAANGRSPAEWGAAIFAQSGCPACHPAAGARGVGPSLAGLWARTTAGTTPLADGRKLGDIIGEGKPLATAEDYLVAQILDPQVVHLAGYPQTAPSFRGQLDDAELAALIAYLKTL